MTQGQAQLVPEIVAEFCRLDRAPDDADALHHVGLRAMAAGFEAEALRLARAVSSATE